MEKTIEVQVCIKISVQAYAIKEHYIKQSHLQKHNSATFLSGTSV